MKCWNPRKAAERNGFPATRHRQIYIGLTSLLAAGALILVALLLGHDDTAQAKAEASLYTTDLGKNATGAGPYLNCHFGTLPSMNPIDAYSVTSLNIGWYGSWGTKLNPPRPGGIEYVQTIRLSDGAVWGGQDHPGPLSYSPSGSTLEAIIAANPGALWLVGNEADCIWQDNVLPENYAQIYHSVYTFIKGHDPTSRVAAGGIVQPTPLRMQYLDLVLEAYDSLYGEPLPTDAWHMHSFILREASCDVYPDSCYGCEIPPGITAAHGMLYILDDSDDIAIFQNRLVQFRQWLKDQGYQNTSLFITEYGTLLPYYAFLYYDSEGNPFDEARASAFMYDTFDYLLVASNPNTGYPPDENRLVQRWLWYSLDDTANYGGALFEPATKDPMQLANDFATYTAAISPTADLFAVDIGQMGPPPLSPSSSVTVTVRLRVSNPGNVAITQPITISLVDGEGAPLFPDQVITEGISGCATVKEITVTWPNLSSGGYVIRAIVDPLDEIDESNEDNNEAEGIVLVASTRVLLPLVPRPGN